MDSAAGGNERQFLRSCSTFSTLSDEALDHLLTLKKERRVSVEEIIVSQGEPPGSMFIVRDGFLRVFLSDGAKRTYVQFLRTGEVFGEVAAFKRLPRTATVESVAEGVLWEVTPEAFQAMFDRWPQFRAGVEERAKQNKYQKAKTIPSDFPPKFIPEELRTAGTPAKP